MSTLVGLGLWLALGLLLGWTFGNVGWWLAAALATYLGWTLNHVYRIEKGLRTGSWPRLDATSGLWAELSARLLLQRKKSRRRKKRYNQLLREIRESTGALADADVLLNPSHEIVWFNRAATELIGLDRRTDIGQRIDNLMRQPEFRKYLETPNPEGVVVPGTRSDDDRLHVQLIPYGRRQSLLIARDVTRQQLLERTRRDFVANASHELRSPLTVIAGYLDTLQEDPELPESWHKPIAEMENQTERMTEILKDLIELSRLESAAREAGDTFVDVRAVLQRIVKTRRPASGPELHLKLDSAAGLLGNEPEVYSIFDNLIANALQFTPATGSVTVTWRENGQGALFEVADTGIGIEQSTIPRITERFFRVDPGRSRDSGGTGLGLAIVKHAAQRHGGDLSVESEIGKGSVFTCRFPADRLVHRG